MPSVTDAPYLQDLTTPTGSRLYSGNKIYLLGAELKYGVKMGIGKKPIPLANPDNQTSDSGSFNLNFSRRKGHLQYVSVNNPEITISGIWTTDLGSTVRGYNIMTPFSLMKFALSGKTLYLYDTRFVSNLVNGDSTYDGLYTGSGVPVVIEDVDFNMVSEDLNKIEYSVSFVEDREVTDTR